MERIIIEKECESNKLRAEHLNSLQVETDDYTFTSENRMQDEAITFITKKHKVELPEHNQ